MNTDKMFISISEIKRKALINFDQVYVWGIIKKR